MQQIALLDVDAGLRPDPELRPKGNYRFAVHRVRRNTLASGDWADRAFSDEDLRRGGVVPL